MNDTTPVRHNRNVSSSLRRAVQGLTASDSRTGRDATFRGHQGREKVMKAGTPGRPWNPTSFDSTLYTRSIIFEHALLSL